MSYSDEKLKQLKERITWLITEKKVYQINVNYEELVALIHRLETAEAIIPYAHCGEELVTAWRKAAGTEPPS